MAEGDVNKLNQENTVDHSFYLQDRFSDANVGPAEKNGIERLYYLTSHLNVDELADSEGEQIMKDWKLFITSETKTVE